MVWYDPRVYFHKIAKLVVVSSAAPYMHTVVIHGNVGLRFMAEYNVMPFAIGPCLHL